MNSNNPNDMRDEASIKKERTQYGQQIRTDTLKMNSVLNHA